MASKNKAIVVSDFLEHKGKWYGKGDEVPMSADEIEWHRMAGSRSIRVESDEAEVILVSASDIPTLPTDDAGQPIDTPATRKLAERAAEEAPPNVVGAPVGAIVSERK